MAAKSGDNATKTTLTKTVPTVKLKFSIFHLSF